jgi:hypothetical protein
LQVLLLLFAQHAAYAHAISHLSDAPPTKGQPDKLNPCNDCASFEKVDGTLPSTDALFVSLDVLFARSPHAKYIFSPRTVVAFNTRAPPDSSD